MRKILTVTEDYCEKQDSSGVSMEQNTQNDKFFEGGQGFG